MGILLPTTLSYFMIISLPHKIPSTRIMKVGVVEILLMAIATAIFASASADGQIVIQVSERTSNLSQCMTMI